MIFRHFSDCSYQPKRPVSPSKPTQWQEEVGSRLPDWVHVRLAGCIYSAQGTAGTRASAMVSRTLPVPFAAIVLASAEVDPTGSCRPGQQSCTCARLQPSAQAHPLSDSRAHQRCECCPDAIVHGGLAGAP